MVRLNEDEKRVYYIHLLKYFEEVELNEDEVEDDELMQLEDIVDNDADHQQDNELPLQVDNDFYTNITLFLKIRRIIRNIWSIF